MKEALKLALEALDGLYMPNELERVNKAIIAINEALMSFQDGAQQSPQRSEDPNNEQADPVACVAEVSTFDGYLKKEVAWNKRVDSFAGGTKFFAQPPVPYVVEPRTAQPKPLTDKKISLLAHNVDPDDWNSIHFRDCWHKGFKAGFREAEVEHNIKG